MNGIHLMIPRYCLGRLAITCLIFLFTAGKINAQPDINIFTYQKPLFDFDYKKPVFKLNEEQSENTNRLFRSSVLTGYREGVKPFKGMMNAEIYNDDKAETSRYCMYNLSIQDMLTNGTKSDQVILLVKDPSKYRYELKYGSEQDWLRKNGYCYEVTLPSAVYTMKTMDMIREDCARQFHVKVTYKQHNEKVIYTITEIQ